MREGREERREGERVGANGSPCLWDHIPSTCKQMGFGGNLRVTGARVTGGNLANWSSGVFFAKTFSPSSLSPSSPRNATANDR